MPKVTDSISNQHARFIETARALGCDEESYGRTWVTTV